jgi:hypothetical protein
MLAVMSRTFNFLALAGVGLSNNNTVPLSTRHYVFKEGNVTGKCGARCLEKK